MYLQLQELHFLSKVLSRLFFQYHIQNGRFLDEDGLEVSVHGPPEWEGSQPSCNRRESENYDNVLRLTSHPQLLECNEMPRKVNKV